MRETGHSVESNLTQKFPAFKAFSEEYIATPIKQAILGFSALVFYFTVYNFAKWA